MTESNTNPVARSWDTYWSGARNNAALTSGGVNNPTILSFWKEYFSDVRGQLPEPSIIDIASGNGAVVECAKLAFDGDLPQFACLDISESAIAMLQKRFPEVNGIVADATSIPLDTACIDIVTSQFGLEYAGSEALDEACRLVASGGQLAFLLHHADGSIYQKCSTSLVAVDEMQTARFIPACTAMFKTGFAARSGGDRAEYEIAAKEFVPAIRVMESIMMNHGRDVADGTIVKLYRDVRTIHERLQNYEASDVLDWLDKMQGEISEYAERMSSMCNAAIDEKSFQEFCLRLKTLGFTLHRNEPLPESGTSTPLAWVLVAKKP